MTRKTYCGNLLWQSGLTLLAPQIAENLPQLVEELVSVPSGQHRQRKGAPQKERSMDALTSSTDAEPIAAVVDSLLCGLVGKIVARLEEIASGFWAMSSTGRALGVACVI